MAAPEDSVLLNLNQTYLTLLKAHFWVREHDDGVFRGAAAWRLGNIVRAAGMQICMASDGKCNDGACLAWDVV